MGAGLLVATEEHERLDVSERAREKCALGLRQPVDVRVRDVPVHEPVPEQAALNHRS
jgi:hypothetical protein